MDKGYDNDLMIANNRQPSAWKCQLSCQETEGCEAFSWSLSEVSGSKKRRYVEIEIVIKSIVTIFSFQSPRDATSITPQKQQFNKNKGGNQDQNSVFKPRKEDKSLGKIHNIDHTFTLLQTCPLSCNSFQNDD